MTDALQQLQKQADAAAFLARALKLMPGLAKYHRGVPSVSPATLAARVGPAKGLAARAVAGTNTAQV